MPARHSHRLAVTATSPAIVIADGPPLRPCRFRPYRDQRIAVPDQPVRASPTAKMIGRLMVVSPLPENVTEGTLVRSYLSCSREHLEGDGCWTTY